MTKILECGLYTQQSSKRKLKIYATAKNKRNYKTWHMRPRNESRGFIEMEAGPLQLELLPLRRNFPARAHPAFRWDY